jgi:hypothetical protein
MVATPVGLAVYSAIGTSVWDLRNLIASWPGFALVLGALLTGPRGRLRWLAVGLVAVGFAIGAAQLLNPENQRPDYAAAAAFVLSHGSHRDPVAIIEAPTPGPYAAMDAALAFAGSRGRPLLRIGAPSLGAVLRAPPYAFLPAPSASALAAQTVCAGGDGNVFVIAPGSAPGRALLGPGVVDSARALGPVFGSGTSGRLFGTVFAPLAAYMRALGPRFALVRTVRLPGFLRLSLYVLRRR